MDKDTKEIFAINLLNVREEKGIPRQKMADDLGISRSSLEYYEKGKRTPDLNTINKISDYLNVSIDYLMGKTDVNTADKDLQYICDYTGLNGTAVHNLHLLKMISMNECNSEEAKHAFIATGKTPEYAMYDLEYVNSVICSPNTPLFNHCSYNLSDYYKDIEESISFYNQVIDFVIDKKVDISTLSKQHFYFLKKNRKLLQKLKVGKYLIVNDFSEELLDSVANDKLREMEHKRCLAIEKLHLMDDLIDEYSKSAGESNGNNS